MSDNNLEKLIKKSMLSMVENSVGSSAYQSFYVKDKSKNLEYDVLNEGEYSCAYFVSSILTIFGLIDRPHATVKSVTERLIKPEWKEVKKSRGLRCCCLGTNSLRKWDRNRPYWIRN